MLLKLKKNLFKIKLKYFILNINILSYEPNQLIYWL